MELKPLTGLSKVLRTLLKINIVLSAAAVLAGIYNFYSYSQLPAGVDINETLLLSDLLTGLIGLVQLVLFIVLGIVFLRWIYRINENLHVHASWGMDFTPGWAIGWYFIPIANLFKPYQAIKEIWQASHRERNGNHTLLGWWWFLWIVSGVFGRIALKFVTRADDAESYATSAAAYIASDAIDLLLNIVALMLVTRIWTAYSQNYVEPEGTLNAMANKFRCKECGSLIAEKSVKWDKRQACPYCGAEDAIA